MNAGRCFTEMVDALGRYCTNNPCGCDGDAHATVMPHSNGMLDRVRIFCTSCGVSTPYHDVRAVDLMSKISPMTVIQGIMDEWLRIQNVVYGTKIPSNWKQEGEKPLSDDELVTKIMGVEDV